MMKNNYPFTIGYSFHISFNNTSSRWRWILFMMKTIRADTLHVELFCFIQWTILYAWLSPVHYHSFYYLNLCVWTRNANTIRLMYYIIVNHRPFCIMFKTSTSSELYILLSNYWLVYHFICVFGQLILIAFIMSEKVYIAKYQLKIFNFKNHSERASTIF